MEALLADLARDPDQRRRRLALSAAALTLATVGGVGLWRGMHASARLCGNAAAAAAGAWDDAQKRAIAAAFAASQLPYAVDAGRAVVRSLDSYVAAWSAMRTEACEATRVRGVQSGELMDLRMQCLDRRLDELKAQVDLLATADVRVVENALAAVDSLPQLDECADATALRAPVRPPADALARGRVAGLRKTLARVRADLTFGKVADGLALAEPALREAHAIGYRPVEAEALYVAGRLNDVDGKYEPAERLLRDAAIAAEAGRDDLLGARSLISLVWVVGVRRGHHPEAAELARQAEAKIERQEHQNHSELLLAELDGYLSSIDMDDAHYDAALAHAKEALDIREKVLGPSEPEVAHSLSDLGDVALQLGRNEEALDHYKRALAIYEKTIGAEHPSVGSVLTNVGVALRKEGRYDEALVQYHQARVVTEHALGPRHPNLASIYLDQAGVERAQGKLDAAAADYQRALDLWTAALGADHPNVGTAYHYLGEIALDQGRPALALERFGAALRIWEAKLGAGNPALAAPLTGMGDALRAQHQLGEARASLQKAVAIVEAALGPKHPELAAPLLSLGEVALDEHKPEVAVPLCERALALHEANPGEKIDEAESRFVLARALRAAHRDPARVQALATQARAVFATTPTAKAKASLATVDKFLHQEQGAR
jgi:tetratricopeptide (TPR) repeat protein